jgi:hypothetical protein
MKPFFMTVFAALALAACNSSAPAPQASASEAEPGSVATTPADFQMPTGEGCAGDIARYRAVTDNDHSMGHVNQSVYNKIKKEIEEAEQQCSDGHDAQARATVLASRKRHGYPIDNF